MRTFKPYLYVTFVLLIASLSFLFAQNQVWLETKGTSSSGCDVEVSDMEATEEPDDCQMTWYGTCPDKKETGKSGFCRHTGDESLDLRGSNKKSKVPAGLKRRCDKEEGVCIDLGVSPIGKSKLKYCKTRTCS